MDGLPFSTELIDSINDFWDDYDEFLLYEELLD